MGCEIQNVYFNDSLYELNALTFGFKNGSA